MLTKVQITQFQAQIWEFYARNRRDLPWRNTENPYHIFLSEIMLQQTQVQRVLPKYEAFLRQFPTFESLAYASFNSVLNVWHGLGYNRRALYLQKAAQMIVDRFNGTVPKDPLELEKLPGIGYATARSIIVFSHNMPLVFIETNIRRVFIHIFFQNSETVSDKDIFPLVEKTLDRKKPRQWYYALMDYGSILPKKVVNPNRKSRHYTKQSKFEGSLRQVRGAILKELIKKKKITISDLEKSLVFDHDFFQQAFAQLLQEGFIVENKGLVKIKN